MHVFESSRRRISTWWRGASCNRALAREDELLPIYDLLKSHFHRSNGPDSGWKILIDGNDEELDEFQLVKL